MPVMRKKYTYSLRPETHQLVVEISDTLGISRSALVDQLLNDGCDMVLRVIDRIPAQPAPDDEVRRASGQSIDYIQSVIEDIKQEVDSLR